jgi:hypothetical protein
MGGKGRESNWIAKVTFVPFRSDTERERAYRTWVKLFIASKAKAVELRKGEKKSHREKMGYRQTASCRIK